MSNKVSEIKKRIRQYTEYKGFSRREFHKLINASDSFLKNDGGFNVDYLPIIRQKCPDLNMDWIVYDDGEMIKEVENLYKSKEPKLTYQKNKDSELLEIYRENRALKKEVIQLKKTIGSLKKDNKLTNKSKLNTN